MAVPLFLWALFAQSGECPSLLERARVAYESRAFTLAADEFERASKSCPNPSEVLLPLAQAQLMARRLEPALETLGQADPRNTDALKLKGDILYLLGRETDAEQALESSLKIDPAHQPSRYALARIYYQQSRFDESAKLFRMLIEQDPNHYRAHDNLALCYAALHQDSEAIRHFLKALDLVYKAHPEYDVVYANAANFFLDRSEFQKAYQLAAEAAKRNPNSARNFFLAGKALVKLEEHGLSVRWFKRAAELDPTYTEPLYWLAQVYRKLGNKEEADRELEKFRELSKAPKLKR